MSGQATDFWLKNQISSNFHELDGLKMTSNSCEPKEVPKLLAGIHTFFQGYGLQEVNISSLHLFGGELLDCGIVPHNAAENTIIW